MTRLTELLGVPKGDGHQRPREERREAENFPRRAWTSRGRPSRITQGIYKPIHPLSGIICDECPVRDHTVRACPNKRAMVKRPEKREEEGYGARIGPASALPRHSAQHCP
ncbi:hypothetical protein LINPERHAP1_LOCUS160, partial [Linum perenne]